MKQVVLVTGGSRGIGLAIVTKFKQMGWQVATCATRLENLKDSPADFKYACDVSDVQQVKAFVGQVLNEFSRIDVLVNNAGLVGNNPMTLDSSDELWHQILNVNLNGTYYFCKYAGQHLPKETGRIVNIASVLASKGVPDAIAYCAAKHGVLGLTRALAHYFAPKKITVNTICPGWVATDMAYDRFKEIGVTVEAVLKSIPLKRLVQPEEIADLTYLLATSMASAMLTGQALTIDGGSLV